MYIYRERVSCLCKPSTGLRRYQHGHLHEVGSNYIIQNHSLLMTGCNLLSLSVFSLSPSLLSVSLSLSLFNGGVVSLSSLCLSVCLSVGHVFEAMKSSRKFCKWHLSIYNFCCCCFFSIKKKEKKKRTIAGREKMKGTFLTKLTPAVFCEQRGKQYTYTRMTSSLPHESQR